MTMVYLRHESPLQNLIPSEAQQTACTILSFPQMIHSLGLIPWQAPVTMVIIEDQCIFLKLFLHYFLDSYRISVKDKLIRRYLLILAFLDMMVSDLSH